MFALYISQAGPGNEQVVRRPRATDAIGSTLRGVFGPDAGLPAEMARLLQRLDRTR